MSEIKKPVMLLILFSLGYVIFFHVSQHLHLGFGYRIWALGEERIWLNLIQKFPTADMVRNFWRLDYRNPLAPWIWHFLSPFILSTDWAFFYLGLLVNPILGITSLLLLNTLNKTKTTFYTFSIALLIVAWNFFYKFDNAALSAYVALDCTLLSLYFYCRHVDNNRANSFNILMSILLYFIAFTTYFPQSGGIVGIFFISIFRTPGNLKNKIIKTLTDVSFFFAFFVLYYMIWFEMAQMDFNSFYFLDIQKTIKAFFLSIYKIIFPPSLLAFYTLQKNDWGINKIAIIFGFSWLVFLLFFTLATHKNKVSINKFSNYAWTAVVLLAISLPTIMIESCSDTYLPGYRSFLLQQVFQPMLYVTFIFFVTQFLARNFFQKLLVILSVSSIGAFAITTSLYYNYYLFQNSYYQIKLIELLKKLPLPQDQSFNFLVKVNRGKNGHIGTENWSRNYSNTIFKNNSFIRLFTNSAQPAGDYYLGKWQVIFKDEGVINAGSLDETNKMYNYKNVLIVVFDGKHLSVPKIVDKNFFDGMQVEWHRTKPIYQN